MRKVKYIRIDEEGFFKEDVLFDYGIIPGDEDIVITEVPEGIYRPKWDGTAWVEGLTQAEIDAIVNAPIPPTATEILGQQLVVLELEKFALQSQNDILGQQLVGLDLRLLALEGGGA